MLIQGVGVLTNEPDFIDITGKDLSIAGQFDFLTHGTLESLVLYLAPTGQSFEINPYGILPVIFSVAFAALIVWRMWCKETGLNISPRLGWSLLALVLLVEFGTSIAWILAPYSQVLVAKANTKFVAANVFLADGRVCEASAMYRIALERSTAYQQQALVRLNQLDLQPGGIPITAGDMLAEEERLGSAIIEEDRATTVTGDGSLMATAADRQDVIARGHSNALPVLPNATYEVSSWFKTENIYGNGFGSVTVSEDDVAFRKIRVTDIVTGDETYGWRHFQKTITTLPTTHRLFIAAGLWKTRGTVWIDGLQIAQITSENRSSGEIKPCD